MRAAPDGFDLVLRANKPVHGVIVDIEWADDVKVMKVAPSAAASSLDLFTHDLGRSAVGVRIAISDSKGRPVPPGALARLVSTGPVRIVASEVWP